MELADQVSTDFPSNFPSTATTRSSGNRTKSRIRNRLGPVRAKEEHPSTATGRVMVSGSDIVTQESLEGEAEADVEGEDDEHPQATTASINTRIGVSTRSGRQPPPSSGPKRRIRRKTGSSGKSRSGKRRAVASDEVNNEHTEGDHMWRDGEQETHSREDESAGASLNGSDSEDSHQHKKAKMPSCMKVLEKVRGHPVRSETYPVTYEIMFLHSSDCSIRSMGTAAY